MSIGKISEFIPGTKNWKTYIARLEQYFIANGISDDLRVPTLISVIGDETYELMVDLCSPDNPTDLEYDHLVRKVTEHLHPAPSIIAERYKFRMRRQEKGENISEFAAALKNLAKDCKFQGQLDDNLRDALVSGLSSDIIKQRLLAENQMSFQKALGIARNLEMAEKDVNILDSSHSEVHRIQGQRNSLKKSQFSNTKKGETAEQFRPIFSQQTRKEMVRKNACKCCGRLNHRFSECYYKNAICANCGVKGHLKYVCRRNKAFSKNGIRNNSYFVNEEVGATSLSTKVKVKESDDINCINIRENSSHNMGSDDSDGDHLFNIVNTEIKEKPIYTKVQIENVLLDMEIDSGCEHSLISDEMYREYFSHLKLSKAELNLAGYTGAKMVAAGMIRVNVEYLNFSGILKLFVIKRGGPPLLGRNWMKILNINIINNRVSHVRDNLGNTKTENLDINSLINEYQSVFEKKLGLLKNFKAKLHLRPNTVPIFCKARSLPINIKSKVEEELSRLVNEGILSPVEYSEWASPIVPVLKKNGEIRICGDFKVSVNKHLYINKYPIPKVETLFASLSEGKYFSKIDLSQAYAQIELEENSKKIVTINTHKGLFQYNRLPYGIASSPGIFQQIIDLTFSNQEGVIVFLDDILVTGSTYQEHLQNLKLVLQKLKDCGLKINVAKCNFFQKSVSYLGYTIDANGLHPSADKIKAISEMKEPMNKNELQSFLGFINFYGKFIPNLSYHANCLYHLLRNNSKFLWTKKCQKSFEWVKSEINSSKVLVYYNQKLPLGLACDASAVGIGACIFHIFPNGDKKPIAFASRTLNDAEKKYSQIDREALSIIFGVKKFHDYLFGRKFILYSDHKPLLSIFGESKPIPQHSASRLQRWAIILSAYQYELKYISSKNNFADVLSRLPLPISSKKEADRGHILHLEEWFPIDHKVVAKETQKDPVLNKVYYYCFHGWFLNENKLDDTLKPFFNRRNELHLEHGCIVWGLRVIIPPSLQKSVLKEIHASHLGISKCKSLARSYCYWPLIDKDIEEVCKACAVCSKVQLNPEKTTLQPWPQTNKAWSRLHLDFLGPIYNLKYLVAVDSHSKWIEVFRMNKTNAKAVIQYLKTLFSTFGLPDTIVTDNGPPFDSHEISNFMKQGGIEHLFSPPYHPSSNGAAENSVKTIKRTIIKAVLEKKNVDEVLLRFLIDYRNCPHSTTGVSPAYVMFGRQLKSRLSLLKPSQFVITNDKIQNQIDNYKSKNRSFDVGDSVLVKDYSQSTKSFWKPGIVTNKKGNVVCEVDVGQGCVVRRHSNQMRKSLISPISPPSTISEDNVTDTSESKESEVSENVAQSSIGLTNDKASNENKDNIESRSRYFLRSGNK